MSDTAAPAPDDLAQLRASIRGVAIGPADPGYDVVRRCFNALIDRRPAVMVRCRDADDVATALDFARSHGLEIAVRGGGHNPAGHCVVDGGLVIDLSLMRDVSVDPAASTARSQGGATWLDFDSATQAFGLVTPGGIVGSTGVTGLTFGGGLGHLTAQHGLTCDHLLGADVVTPSGKVVQAGDGGDSELLWGLRGGGGNFGVATELRFRLHPLERVVGGRYLFAGSDAAAQALRRFRDVVAADPRDLSCQTLLGNDPESGAVVAIVSPCYTGADSDTEALRTLRSSPGLAQDGVHPQSFIAQQHVFNPTYGEDRAYWKGHFVRELPDELIDTLVARMEAMGDRSPGQILIESLHGAPKDTDDDSAALGFRGAAFNISAMGSWLDPALDDDYIAWTRETAAALEPWSHTGGGYVNYMQADEPIERVRAAFGDERFGRLQALKSKYDPENLLRRNQNIPPAA